MKKVSSRLLKTFFSWRCGFFFWFFCTNSSLLAQEESDLNRQLKALDALIAEAGSQIVFYSEFSVETGLSDQLDLDVEAFFREKTGEESQYGLGQLIVGAEAYRYKFDLLVPVLFHQGSTWATSREFSWGRRCMLSYEPHQRTTDEKVQIGERIVLTPRPDADVIQGWPSMEVCPWYGQGYAKGFLFGRYSELEPGFFETKRISYPGIQEKVLEVTGKIGAQPKPFNVIWVIDDTDVYPVLLEHQTRSRLTRYTQIKKLESGIRVPMECVSLTRFNADDGEPFEVKRWRFTKFEERVPADNEFAIHVTSEVSASGLEVKEGSTSINILELERDPRLEFPSENREAFQHRRLEVLDEDFSEFSEDRPNYSANWILSLIFGVIAFVAAICLVRSLVQPKSLKK